MKPELNDDFITLPITLDYKGGRSTKGRTARNVALVLLGVWLLFTIVFMLKADKGLLFKIGFVSVLFFLLLRFCCIVLFKEKYIKKIYTSLQETDGELDYTTLWRIFEIDEEYPHICYFSNGRRGLFIRMERGTITGKGEDAPYYHYEAISDAYNIAHSLNLNMIHIDYMTGIGVDKRIERMELEASQLQNETMRSMMLDIYDNLKEGIKVNYSCFDVYLFLTAGRIDGFFDSVQTVCEAMLQGSNYISYTCMRRDEVSTLCRDLFNLNDFDSVDISKTLVRDSSKDIIPIQVVYDDGRKEVFAKSSKQLKEEEEKRTHDFEVEREKLEAQKKFKKRLKKGDDKIDIDI